MNQDPGDISVCIAASGDWASSSRVNCHEIATRWVSRGPVVYVEPAPLRSPRWHDLGRLWRRLAGVVSTTEFPEPGLVRGVDVVAPPFLPWHPTQAVRGWNTAVAARAVRRRLQLLDRGGIDVLWFFSPALAGLERRLPADLLIYHVVDDYCANPGARAALLERRERELLASIHLVFAASAPLAARLREMHPCVLTWENVSDTESLIADAEEHGLRRAPSDPRTAVYVGQLSDHKVDFTLLLHVVQRMPEWRFILGGPVGRVGRAGRQVLGEPNVRYIGPVLRADLARTLANADAALLPLPDSSLHESSFPMKVLDYLALGLPIVGRRAASLGGFGDLIQHAVTAADYGDALERARVLRHDDAYGARAIQVAQRHSWAGRMAELEATVRHALDQRRAAKVTRLVT